ncbi:helix-turn-helix domain-containing protein [Streptomyces erythrochromogenes]|uniref:helix-turn-helix domain-containing protein n=1 Tax=Streptomyces erythrochromogenes TaxID=285574 RepID=UPI00331FCD7E
MSQGRRGRPERPVTTSVPALAELAHHLRELRRRAGLTLEALAKATYRSKASLSAATTGRVLPSWGLVEDWVKACTPEENPTQTNFDLWEDRYNRAREQHAAARARLRQPSGSSRTDQVSPPASPPRRQERQLQASAEPDRAPVKPDAPVMPSALERDAWRSLAPDARAWSAAAHPSALKIRYETVGSDLVDSVDGASLTGHYGIIGEIFRLAHARCMLILGPAGSGKTQLARHLGTELLSARDGRDSKAVPVLLSLRGWRGSFGLDDLLGFLAGSLTDASPSEVRALLGRGELLPMFDDFDTLAPGDRLPALQALNLLAQQTSFVLISNDDVYTSTVVDSDMVITGSAGIKLCPLTGMDLDGWIQRGMRSESKCLAWQSVLDHVSAHPHAPAAAVLADPMLAGAARLLYTDGRADPSELIAPDATQAALEHRLVAYLVNTHIPRRQSPEGHPPGAARRQQLALSMLASRQDDLSTPVSTRSSLYPRPPIRRWWALVTAFLLFLGCLQVISVLSSDPFSGADSSISLDGLFIAAIAGCGCYTWLRRTDNRSRPWLPRSGVWGALCSRATLLTLVLCPMALGIVVIGTPSQSAGYGLVMFTTGCAGFIWVHARWGARSTTGRMLTELLLVCLVLYAAVLGEISLMPLSLVGTLLLGTTTVHWRWLRASIRSGLAWLPLTPGRLAASVDTASQQGMIRCDHDHYTFTHHALLHFYRTVSTPAGTQRTGDQNTITALWRSAQGRHHTEQTKRTDSRPPEGQQ